MGQQVQESQIANYKRRLQREVPAALAPTLFEQNDVLCQTYTVTLSADMGDDGPIRFHAIVNDEAAGGRFIVIDSEGQAVGCIDGESGRVLAEEVEKNGLYAVPLCVVGRVPVTGDLRVQIREG